MKMESELFWVLCYVRKKIIMKRSCFEKGNNFIAENLISFFLCCGLVFPRIL